MLIPPTFPADLRVAPAQGMESSCVCEAIEAVTVLIGLLFVARLVSWEGSRLMFDHYSLRALTIWLAQFSMVLGKIPK
jgi:hypothetical protein